MDLHSLTIQIEKLKEENQKLKAANGQLKMEHEQRGIQNQKQADKLTELQKVILEKNKKITKLTQTSPSREHEQRGIQNKKQADKLTELQKVIVEKNEKIKKLTQTSPSENEKNEKLKNQKEELSRLKNVVIEKYNEIIGLKTKLNKLEKIKNNSSSQINSNIYNRSEVTNELSSEELIANYKKEVDSLKLSLQRSEETVRFLRSSQSDNASKSVNDFVDQKSKDDQVYENKIELLKEKAEEQKEENIRLRNQMNVIIQTRNDQIRRIEEEKRELQRQLENAQFRDFPMNNLNNYNF